MSEFKSLPETQLDKVTSQEVMLFYKYLSKDKEIKHVEIDKSTVKYELKNYFAEVTFKTKLK